MVTALQPGDGDVAGVVVQGGDEPGQERRGIQHGAAEHARVHGVVEDLDLDGAVDESAQARGQGGDADLPVAGVGDDDDVGPELVLIGLEEGAEGRRPGLLLALDEQGHADAERVAEHLGDGRDRADVRHDARLVVGGAAAVQPAVAFVGDERLGLPQGRVPRRLHVVVGVQQDRSAFPSAAGRRATTAGPPGVPSLSTRRIRTSSRPAARIRSATASALRSSAGGSKLPGDALDGDEAP